MGESELCRSMHCGFYTETLFFFLFPTLSLIISIFLWLSRSLSQSCCRTNSCSPTLSFLHISIQHSVHHFVCKAGIFFSPGTSLYVYSRCIPSIILIAQSLKHGRSICRSLQVVLIFTFLTTLVSSTECHLPSHSFLRLIMNMLNSTAPSLAVCKTALVSWLCCETFDHLILPSVSYLYSQLFIHVKTLTFLQVFFQFP